jgi:uncharacterized UPF0160 family protein
VHAGWFFSWRFHFTFSYFYYFFRYRVTTTLSQRVSRLNASWREKNPDPMVGFNTALQVVRTEFVERVHHYATDWWEAYSIVATAVENRFDVRYIIIIYKITVGEIYCYFVINFGFLFYRFEQVDRSGKIIELTSGGVPWKDHLAEIEAQTGVDIRFVIFSDQNAQWRVQAVPITPDSFILR